MTAAMGFTENLNRKIPLRLREELDRQARLGGRTAHQLVGEGTILLRRTSRGITWLRGRMRSVAAQDVTPQRARPALIPHDGIMTAPFHELDTVEVR